MQLSGWIDGKFQENTVDELNRWLVHTADTVSIHIAGYSIKIHQHPHDESVASYVWDGALVLAKYIESLPRHRWLSTRCIELGSGTGLVGILLALLGASVVLTDLKSSLPLIEHNVKENLQSSMDCRVCELEWGKHQSIAKQLNDPPIDYILASDCLYEEAMVRPFVDAIADLTTVSSKNQSPIIWICFEKRTEKVYHLFFEAIQQRNMKAVKVSLAKLPENFRPEQVELWQLVILH